MARSRFHTPITGITLAESEKRDKQLWHRHYRRCERQNLAMCVDWDEYITVHEREVSNPWMFDKDGKRWFDLIRYPDLMRLLRK
jgi:hypothetical protein